MTEERYASRAEDWRNLYRESEFTAEEYAQYKAKLGAVSKISLGIR